MKKQDFRVGNLIYDFCDGEGEILAIDKDGYVLTTANDVPQPAETFTGITLTEEWLIKFGFESDSNHFKIMVWDRGALWITFPSDDLICFEIGNTKEHIVAIRGRMSFVHQLQNLYFALTGTELTIKP